MSILQAKEASIKSPFESIDLSTLSINSSESQFFSFEDAFQCKYTAYCRPLSTNRKIEERTNKLIRNESVDYNRSLCLDEKRQLLAFMLSNFGHYWEFGRLYRFLVVEDIHTNLRNACESNNIELPEFAKIILKEQINVV
ncbi:MAG: hypothetical protein Sylvanvirus7_8 [Sylvanvirus sp.]|uniref:Uncharacterized protein n=1 Tax=Sylvanvirus sp. TaxID=2487774 RepID=A0A3G5AHR4_9VIRU|nr:MAG: hypothetical protein Sylvanvirus7_8 [Sylvanvirus sp.]